MEMFVLKEALKEGSLTVAAFVVTVLLGTAGLLTYVGIWVLLSWAIGFFPTLIVMVLATVGIEAAIERLKEVRRLRSGYLRYLRP